MFRTLKDGPILPADVFHHSLNWREISRDEAVDLAGSGRVVIVFRNGAIDYADWFEPGHPFFCGVGPHALGSVRYYRYRDQPIRPSDVSGAARAAAPEVAPEPAARPAKAPEVKKTWIEIELLDQKGVPVPGEPYTIRLPDGSTRSGSLDSSGRARVDDIDPGVCDVTFPEIDRRSQRAA